jgi:uncharacterized protein (DUF2147 family)
MKFQTLCSVFAVTMSAFVGAAAAHADPRGLWLAEDGAQVRVASCGKAICGKIAVAKSPTNPDTGQPWTGKVDWGIIRYRARPKLLWAPLRHRPEDP